MFSPAKKEDKKFMLELADLIELLASIGTPQALDLAEKYGDNYMELENKIRTHDYTRDDQRIEKLENLLCQPFTQ